MEKLTNQNSLDSDYRFNRIEHIFKFIEYEKLNDWEDRFVASVSDQFDKRGTLTDNQYDKLEEVFERSTERD